MLLDPRSTSMRVYAHVYPTNDTRTRTVMTGAYGTMHWQYYYEFSIDNIY